MKRTLKHAEKKRLLSEITDRLTELCPDLVAAYVFGSFISADAFSDMDLGLLFSENPSKPLLLELDLETELERTTACPVDVRVLNGAPLSFVQSVIRTGEVIVDVDPNRRADFEGLILKKYFDFAPFRARYLAEVTNAPL
ncbi:MAG: nucleotidyltransferase domain-containing protein [Desulfobacteraceae bacterium]|jgi:predicted nucleotidyltransferase